ncbi:MAG: hypothetical protein KTR35_18630 [Gammaproteobacteria bacterium]|nr:hypothetical protein [Gammaproteobacteria bacterium]
MATPSRATSEEPNIDTPSAKLPWFSQLGEIASSRFILSVGAQALVSGFHFGLNWLLLQRMSLFDYGVFAFAFFTLAQFAAAMNNALISTPLTVYTPMVKDEKERLEKEAMFSLLNVLLFLTLIIVGLGYLWWSGLASNLVLSVTLFVALYAARQYSRCLGYARLRPLVTASGDTVYVLVGIIVLAISLYRTPELKVEWVLVYLSIANLAAMLWERLRLHGSWWRGYDFSQLKNYSEVWLQSRWALVGAMTTLLMAQAHSVLITWVKGPAAFAPLAAGFVLFGPVRVALLTWQNMVKPEIAVALSNNEHKAVQKQVRRTSILMSAAVVLLGFLLWLGWPWLHEALYAKKYADEPMLFIVICWSAVAFFSASYNAPSAALQALRNFKVLAVSSIYGAIIAFVFVALLLYWFDPVHTLFGIMAAECFMAIYLMRLVFKQLRSHQ